MSSTCVLAYVSAMHGAGHLACGQPCAVEWQSWCMQASATSAQHADLQGGQDLVQHALAHLADQLADAGGRHLAALLDCNSMSHTTDVLMQTEQECAAAAAGMARRLAPAVLRLTWRGERLDQVVHQHGQDLGGSARCVHHHRLPDMHRRGAHAVCGVAACHEDVRQHLQDSAGGAAHWPSLDL
jgi:hypothetical protein